MEKLASFLHACAGYPVTGTLCKAILMGYYSSWPHLSQANGAFWILKHLPKSMVTTMGHMKAVRSNTRSTSKPTIKPTTEPSPKKIKLIIMTTI